MSTDASVRANGPSIVLALFEVESDARAVVDALRSRSFDDRQVGVLTPGQSLNASQTAVGDISSMLALAASAPNVAGTTDLSEVLVSMGVPDGQARFYAGEARDGRTLVIVKANGRFDEVHRLVLEHDGYDVQSRGAELIRGEVQGPENTRAGEPDGGGVPGGVGPRAIDVTSNWPDFASRYEMLWQQHYGTTDATWPQMEPLYHYAWQLANAPEYRGRPWDEVESAIAGNWKTSELSQSLSWSDAAGPIRDVWEDVAEEAATGAEGGADRRVARQGTDQLVAARDLIPPHEGAA